MGSSGTGYPRIEAGEHHTWSWGSPAFHALVSICSFVQGEKTNQTKTQAEFRLLLRRTQEGVFTGAAVPDKPNLVDVTYTKPLGAADSVNLPHFELQILLQGPV